MDDLRLREALRPLADSISTRKQLEAQRMLREGFRDDGTLERRAVGDVITLDRLDWVVAPSAPAGMQTARFFIPEDSRILRIAIVATANVSATFGVDVLVNGARKGSASIRSGTSQSHGALGLHAIAGSVVSIQTTTSIPQGVTVSVFYRPEEI